MPVSDQNNQLAQLMQAIQSQKMLQQLMQQSQPQPGQPPAPPPQGAQMGGLGAMLGGQNSMGPRPPTLGMNQPMPMQLPPMASQGDQKQPPMPPDPMALGGAGPQ